MKQTCIVFLTLLSLITQGQIDKIDHLEPARNLFSLYKHEQDYYPFIAKHLLNDLSDVPIARMLMLPSFSSENVLSIESADNGKTYKAIFKICKESIWYKKNRNAIEVTRYEEPIDTSLVNLIGNVFQVVTSETMYPPVGVPPSTGLDGTTYYFSSFAGLGGMRAGTVWSPSPGTKMNALVEFGEVIIQFAKSDNDTDRMKFKKEIKDKGNKLLLTLNAH
jgi:hypothetical protein